MNPTTNGSERIELWKCPSRRPEPESRTLLFQLFLVEVYPKFPRLAMEVHVIRAIKELLLLVRLALGLAAINKIMELFKQIRQLQEELAIRSIMEM